MDRPAFALLAATRQPSLRWVRRAEADATSEGWWSQTGSNRRPHACKARALPAELWPRTRRRMLLGTPSSRQPARLRPMGYGSLHSLRERRLVGLGRLELPTSRLSSARSNQLSYKPLTLSLSKRIRNRLARKPAPGAPGATAQARQPLARVRPRRKRNVDGEIPPMELSNPETAGP